MAYSTEAVAAHPDTPTICGSHGLENPLTSPTGSKWTYSGQTGHGTFSAVDNTHSVYPIVALHNRDLGGEDTRPSVSTVTEYYLVLRTSGGVSFDTVVLCMGNADTYPVTNALLETADDDAFATNLTTIWNLGGPGNNKRQVVMLGTRYNNVDRVRLRLQRGSAWQPQVTELWLTRRYNIAQQPKGPWDEQSRRSDVSITRTKGGLFTVYSRATGGRYGTARFESDASADYGNFRSGLAGADYAAKPFLWVDNPNTSPGSAIVVVSPAAQIEAALQSWALSARDFELQFEESAPYKVKE